MKIQIDVDLQARAEDEGFSSIEDMIVSRAVDKVTDRISRSLEDNVEKLAKERAILTIDAVLDDLQLSKFQPTNAYGQPTGDPKTFLELVLETVDEWGSQRVDYQGRPTNSSSDKKTRIEWLGYKLANDIAAEHMKEMMEELKAAGSDKVGAIVSAGIEKAFGIQKKR